MPLRHGSDCSQSGPHPLRVWSFWPQKATNHPFAPEVDDSWPIASCILRGREMQPIETHMDDRFSKSYSQFQFQREQAWTWSPVSRDWNHLVCWRTWSYMATKLSRAGICLGPVNAAQRNSQFNENDSHIFTKMASHATYCDTVCSKSLTISYNHLRPTDPDRVLDFLLAPVCPPTCLAPSVFTGPEHVILRITCPTSGPWLSACGQPPGAPEMFGCSPSFVTLARSRDEGIKWNECIASLKWNSIEPDVQWIWSYASIMGCCSSFFAKETSICCQTIHHFPLRDQQLLPVSFSISAPSS